jgi:hypothetical protein
MDSVLALQSASCSLVSRLRFVVVAAPESIVDQRQLRRWLADPRPVGRSDAAPAGWRRVGAVPGERKSAPIMAATNAIPAMVVAVMTDTPTKGGEHR